MTKKPLIIAMYVAVAAAVIWVLYKMMKPTPLSLDDCGSSNVSNKEDEDYSYSFGFPTWGEYNNPYIRGYPYNPFMWPYWPRPRRYFRQRWW